MVDRQGADGETITDIGQGVWKVALGAVTGITRRYVSTAGGTTGADSEEDPRQVSVIRHPMSRGRVVQTSAMLVLSPIFEADLNRSNMGTGRDEARRMRSIVSTDY